MQNLMEHDHGWEDLILDFINKVKKEVRLLRYVKYSLS